ncbi:MAG: hypothetical protein IPJ07_18095 [Acidobacteria bacterium]|nr:hypothetical protein [Acidobacteriota bacterium]
MVIYPVVFVYRQGIELSLKHLAGYLPFLWDEHHDVVLSHKLIDNWRTIRPFIYRGVDLDPENTVPSVDKILADFTEIDPSGEVFRFPESRRGQKHLEETSIINVEVFAQAMATLDEIFDFWFHVTSELFDGKMDAQNQAGV